MHILQMGLFCLDLQGKVLLLPVSHQRLPFSSPHCLLLCQLGVAFSQYETVQKSHLLPAAGCTPHQLLPVVQCYMSHVGQNSTGQSADLHAQLGTFHPQKLNRCDDMRIMGKDKFGHHSTLKDNNGRYMTLSGNNACACIKRHTCL